MYYLKNSEIYSLNLETKQNLFVKYYGFETYNIQIRRGKNDKIYVIYNSTDKKSYLDEIVGNTTKTIFLSNSVTNGGIPQTVYSEKKTCIENSYLPIYTYFVGKKVYELKDHLGNVRVVLSDKRGGNAISWTDYYAFGMAKVGRSGGNYRFGFNGQEKVEEIATGHYTALFWEYDSRLARRWNQDPKPNPSISNYAVFANNPIWFSDALGDTSTVNVKFQKGIDGSVLHNYTLNIIEDIAQQAGLSEVEISSTYRSPERQINAMYNNLITVNGVKTQKALYGKKGDLVIDAYVTATKENLTPLEIKKKMFEKAIEVGFMSNHSSSDYSKYNVVDISYKKLTNNQYKALRKAAELDTRIQVVLGKEEGDKGLHLEIPILQVITSNKIKISKNYPTYEMKTDNTLVVKNTPLNKKYSSTNINWRAIFFLSPPPKYSVPR